MGCKLGKIRRLAKTGGGRGAEEAHWRMERIVESGEGEGLQAEEADERIEMISESGEGRQDEEENERIEMISRSGEGQQADEEHRRIETVSESGEWRQVEEPRHQERMERIIEQSEGWQMEVVGEGWQVEEAQEGRGMERVDEAGEGIQGEEAQVRVSHLGEGGQVQGEEEIEARTELATIQLEIRRLRRILREEEMSLRNRWAWEIRDRIETIRIRISVLEYRGWRTILYRSRIIAEGDVPHFLHYDAVHYGSRRGALPVSRATVDGLPSILIQQQQDDDGDASCVVCLEVLACGESAKQLPCLHFYHNYCILRWLQSQNSCPVCRREIPTENLH